MEYKTLKPEKILKFEKEPTNIVFMIHDKEMIKIDERGFYVEGEKIVDDIEIYHQFKKWLDLAHDDRDE